MEVLLSRDVVAGERRSIDVRLGSVRRLGEPIPLRVYYYACCMNGLCLLLGDLLLRVEVAG